MGGQIYDLVEGEIGIGLPEPAEVVEVEPVAHDPPDLCRRQLDETVTLDGVGECPQITAVHGDVDCLSHGHGNSGLPQTDHVGRADVVVEQSLGIAPVYVAAGWWLVAAVTGIWVGRRAEATPPIARLLAGARAQTTLPELRPGLTIANRLWPLLLSTFTAGVLGFFLPQVAAVAAGFAIIWALAWRRQESAVAAIEERDGVRFYVEPTSPLRPMALVRTPGFGGRFISVDGTP